MFPQNVYRVLFQWNKAGLGLFQLSFDSPVLKVNVYTDGVHATCTTAGTGGACWESDQTNWAYLAAANAGQAVTFKIRGVESATSNTIYESPAYTIRFSKKAVPGAIYYWSTTVAGVRRGALGDPAPQNFLTPDEAQGKCVACHTLSRNGKKLAADIGGEQVGVVDVVRTVPPPVVFGPIGIPVVKIPSSWATFNPDTTRVVASKKGVMKLLDGTTGAAIGAGGGVIPLGMGVLAAQPDWAPDGKHLVFAAGNVDRGGAASIGWLSVSGDTFSGFETIVAPTAGQMYGYPMFNPTSDWLVFARGAKIQKDLTDQILVAPAMPGAQGQELVRANTLVNDATVADRHREQHAHVGSLRSAGHAVGGLRELARLRVRASQRFQVRRRQAAALDRRHRHGEARLGRSQLSGLPRSLHRADRELPSPLLGRRRAQSASAGRRGHTAAAAVMRGRASPRERTVRQGNAARDSSACPTLRATSTLARSS